jgi:Fic family protein
MRIMNTYYSNLIEGHDTRPGDIERALAGQLEKDKGRRNLQLEAAAHVRVQAEVDRMAIEGSLPEPASTDFISRKSRRLKALHGSCRHAETGDLDGRGNLSLRALTDFVGWFL